MDWRVREIIDRKYERCVARVVHRLRRFPADHWYGDDCPLINLWEYWVAELQGGHSVMMHGAIEYTIDPFVAAVAASLPEEDRMLLYLVTREADEEEFQSVLDSPRLHPEQRAIERELWSRLNARACDEPLNDRLEKWLFGNDLARFEEDRELHRRDGAAPG